MQMIVCKNIRFNKTINKPTLFDYFLVGGKTPTFFFIYVQILFYLRLLTLMCLYVKIRYKNGRGKPRCFTIRIVEKSKLA